MKKRGILLCVAGLAILGLILAVVARRPSDKAPPKAAGDLAEAQGRIDSYSFLDDSRGMRRYIIYLKGYRAGFQIPADFVKYFATARFETTLKKGDEVSIAIPADSAAGLTSSTAVPVFAIHSRTATYLDEHYTLIAYNNRGKSDKPTSTARVPTTLLIGAGTIVLVAGLAFAIWKTAKTLSQRAPKLEMAPGELEESSQRLKKAATKREPKPKLLTMGDPEPRMDEMAVTSDEGQG